MVTGYDAATLEADVKALEAKLQQPSRAEHPSALEKALDLLGAAIGALGIKRSGKAGATLEKAIKQDDGQEAMDDDAGADPDTQAFIDKLLAEHSDDDTDDTNDAGAMRKSLKPSPLRKALATGDDGVPAVVVNDYMTAELAIREAMSGQLATLGKQQAVLLKAVGVLAQENAQLRQGMGAVLKGQMALLAQQDQAASTPQASKFESMLKAAGPILGANGGHEAPYSKETAARMLSKGLLTTEQHRVWKTTNRLPDGVAIAAA